MQRASFLVLTFLGSVVSDRDQNDKTGYHLPNDSYAESALVWGSFFILLGVVLSFIHKFKIPIHYTVFALIFGLVSGLIVNSSKKIHTGVNLLQQISTTDYLYFLYFYCPGIIFKTTFCLDMYTFTKSISQILIISFPVALLTGCSLGVILRFMITTKWTFSATIMLGILCSPIYTAHTEKYLKYIDIHMKHTTTLLNGEAAVAVIGSFVGYTLFFGYNLHFLQLWYQYIIAFLRIMVMGVLSGYCCGLFGRFILRQIYTAQVGVVMFIFGLPFFSFSITELYLGGCGALSVLVVGIMMANERSSLSSETDKLLDHFWRMLEVLLNTVTCISVGIYFSNFIKKIHTTSYVIGFSIYLLYYLIRFLSFLIFAPLLTRVGYGMSFKTMLICVVGGIKSPFCIMLGMGLCTKAAGFKPKERVWFSFDIVLLYIFSYLFNGIFMPFFIKALGVSQVSMVKQINMNNCIKHILAKRQRMIAVLKMNRYLSDANWPVVKEATTLKRKGKKKPTEEEEEEEEDDFFIGYRYTYCGNCKKDVVEEPTKKELQEMTKEAKLRILKAKKMIYIRHHENGMICKETLRILIQAVDLAMDSKDAVIEIGHLEHRFSKEGRFTNFIRKRMNEIKIKKERIRPPKTYWRRLCYKLVNTTGFNMFIYIVIVVNTVLIILDLCNIGKNSAENQRLEFYFLMGEWACFAIYLFEIVVKVLGYSRNGICRDGFPNYFRPLMNKLDFALVLVLLLDLTIELSNFFQAEANSSTMETFLSVLKIIKLLRLVRLFDLLHTFYPKVVKKFDSTMDANMAFTYELGKAYATGEEEIVKMIPQIIDHEKIQDELKEQIEHDRIVITKLLGIVQKEKPYIAITVKTKQAIRAIINGMKDAVLELKVAGWTDNFEHRKLMEGIHKMYRHAATIKEVQPSSPDVIFKEVSWMANDEAVFDFLFENVAVQRFEPGEIVFGEGKVADGIYIVVTGLLLLTYTPEEYFLKSLENYGILPIADYVSITQYYENVTEYIVSGNCMGELSILTGRSYNCTITAEAHSQVYVLSNGVIRRAMELSPDFINGLECRIWKDVSIRIALPILMAVPTYHSSTIDQLKYALERAFMPNLKYYKIFTVTDMIQDILVIEGVARDFHSRDLFQGPCYIPRTVQKLILPASSLIDIPINIETRLMIIPENGVDEFDVMLLAEETCEMVAVGSEFKCLHHTVQDVTARLRRRHRSEFSGSGGKKKRFAGSSLSEEFSRYTTSASQSTMKVVSTAIFADDEKEVGSHKYDRQTSY